MGANERVQKNSQLLDRTAKTIPRLLHIEIVLTEVFIKQENGISRIKVVRSSKDDLSGQRNRKTTEVRPFADVLLDKLNHTPEQTTYLRDVKMLAARARPDGFALNIRYICSFRKLVSLSSKAGPICTRLD